MKITTLKQNPEYFDKTIKLIETAFGYEGENSFQTDFYPLIKEDNLDNCFVLIENNEVVAHIGSLKREFKIEDKSFSFTMYGGIAVNENYRGQGKFGELFKQILEYNSEETFHVLWSDKVEMYNKFGFFPCLELNQYEQKDNNESYPQLYDVHQCYMIDLTNEEFEQIKTLYNSTTKEKRIDRDDKHWNELREITSAKIYLVYQGDDLVNYFIRDKGQDLTNIIHEYGHINKEQLELMQNFGIVWSPQRFENESPLFATLLKIGDENHFKEFINAYSPLDIKSLGEEILFHFDGQEFTQPLNEFLLGVFGPGRFEEISAPLISFSGLDSI